MFYSSDNRSISAVSVFHSTHHTVQPRLYHSKWTMVVLWLNHGSRTVVAQLAPRGVSRSKIVGWAHMASAEREPITGVWGQSPQQGPGAEPLVRGHGGEAPWSWKPFSFWMPNGSSKFAPFSVFCNSLNPTYLWHISQITEGIVLDGMDNSVYTEKQFGIVLLVIWEVALQSKLAQIVAQTLTVKPHWTTEPKHSSLRLLRLEFHNSYKRDRVRPDRFPLPVKTRQICINLRNNLWQKWAGYVHPVATPLPAPSWN